MTKRLPAAPAPGPLKDHEARFDYHSEPRRREATLLDTAETRNQTEPGHPMLPTLLYALIVPELLAMSLWATGQHLTAM